MAGCAGQAQRGGQPPPRDLHRLRQHLAVHRGLCPVRQSVPFPAPANRRGAVCPWPPRGDPHRGAGQCTAGWETGYNLELGLRKTAGRLTYSLSLFRNQVDDFIHAADAGYDPGGDYRVVEYRQDDAVLRGFEASAALALSDRLELGLFADSVRGRLRDGGNLERIPADRYGLRLNRQITSALDGELEAYRVERQDRLAEHETGTDGYTMLNAGLSF